MVDPFHDRPFHRHRCRFYAASAVFLSLCQIVLATERTTIIKRNLFGLFSFSIDHYFNLGTELPFMVSCGVRVIFAVCNRAPSLRRTAGHSQEIYLFSTIYLKFYNLDHVPVQSCLPWSTGGFRVLFQSMRFPLCQGRKVSNVLPVTILTCNQRFRDEIRERAPSVERAVIEKIRIYSNTTVQRNQCPVNTAGCH